MFLVEASRGCEWGCRFCAAGYMYRPIRHRSAASLREDVLGTALEHRKTIGLVGAEMASMPGIAALCASVAERGGRASPSSLKADLISPALAAALGGSDDAAVTIAPEAGSERMRRVINKNLTEAEILRAADCWSAGGVPALKLYFMIGLPTETDEDVLAIVDLAAKIRARLARGVGRITLSVNPFVPEAVDAVPVGADGRISSCCASGRSCCARAAQRIPGVERRRRVAARGVLADACCRAAIAASRRCCSPCTPPAATCGRCCRRRCAPVGSTAARRPTTSCTGATRPDEILPWDFIDHGVDKRYLLVEWRKALLERQTAPCDVTTCHTCSAC